MKYIVVEFSTGYGAYEEKGYVVGDNVTIADIPFYKEICSDFDEFCDHYIPPMIWDEKDYDEYYEGCAWQWYEVDKEEYVERFGEPKTTYVVTITIMKEYVADNPEEAINKAMDDYPDGADYEVEEK